MAATRNGHRLRRPRNANIRSAQKNKYDEFYTQLADIEIELEKYKKDFDGKIIYCNADDPRVSAFFRYFAYQFELLNLKKLLTTCYKNQDIDLFTRQNAERAVAIRYTGTNNPQHIPDTEDLEVIQLHGDGDFRSAEAIEFLREADIVVTNPPFSLFREYVQQLIDYDKKFIILGNLNALTYKSIFKLIQEGKIWLGYNKHGTEMTFRVPDDADKYIKHCVRGKDQHLYKQMAAIWFTNLPVQRDKNDLILYRRYVPESYPKYDHYDAINVDRVSEIPNDYYGVMGVPITYLLKHDPDRFEIIDAMGRYAILDVAGANAEAARKHVQLTEINGNPKYFRILIKRKEV